MDLAAIIFPKSDQDAVPIAIRKRMPFLIYTNMALMIFFFGASYLRYSENPSYYSTFFLVLNLTNAFFLSSLVLIRFRKYLAASFLTSVGLILNPTWVGTFLPITNAGDIYRYSTYLLCAMFANNLVSFGARQIVGYGIASLVSLLFIVFFVMSPALGGISGEARTIILLVLFLFLLMNVIVVLVERHNRNLVQMAEVEMKRNRIKALQLENLISGAKGTLEIGKVLKNASSESMTAGESIKKSLVTLSEFAKSLRGDAGQTDEINKEIVRHAHDMNTTVAQHTRVLHTASSAVTEIMATIQNIAKLAQDRRQTINRVLGNAEAQGLEIRKVIDGLSKIQDASARVLTVAGGILDVSEKTNMLAMNASIEAAHAGNAGKGFAVISSEIRKLSDETKQSTVSIGEALEQNKDVVNDAASIVRRFTGNIEVIIADVRDTFNAIDQIIGGLAEISLATTELTKTTGEMMEMADKTEYVVRQVTEKIESGSASVGKISSFSADLHDKVAKIVEDYRRIESTLASVSEIGDRNIHNMSTLETELDRIMAR